MFRLRRSTKRWFRYLEEAGDISYDFDMYYLALMAGLATGRKDDATSADAPDFIGYFPGPYAANARLIVATFLSRELRELGISLGERQAVHNAIRELIDPLSSAHLSDAGYRAMNRYSFGGSNVLAEWFDDAPRSAQAFFVHYREYIETALRRSAAEEAEMLQPV